MWEGEEFMTCMTCKGLPVDPAYKVWARAMIQYAVRTAIASLEDEASVL